MKHIPGVDMSSGSLGQGLSTAVGMALAAKLSGKDYRTYCLCGDGEIQEGQIWEAAMFAGARKLDNLLVIVDNNNLQIDGTVEEVCSPYPIDKKFEAFNFHVININGNDFDEIDAAFKEAKATKGMPTAIIAHTVKGKGVSFMENNVGWHGKAPGEEEHAIAIEESLRRKVKNYVRSKENRHQRQLWKCSCRIGKEHDVWLFLMLTLRTQTAIFKKEFPDRHILTVESQSAT